MERANEQEILQKQALVWKITPVLTHASELYSRGR